MAASGYGEVPVTAVGGHDHVAEVVSQLFQPNLGLVKESLFLEL
jgi:hypothetical protein